MRPLVYGSFDGTALRHSRTLLTRHAARYAAGVIDLHTHSSYSDGSDTPTQLARQAHELGISVIALTDHDTTSSHEEMRAACDEWGIEYITGVEISLRDNEFPRRRGDEITARNVHVLAYFPPLAPEHPLQKRLTDLRHGRDQRNQKLVRLLQGYGFERLSFEYLTTLARSAYSVGRPHFAQAMFDLHPEIVGEQNEENWRRVFADWLGTSGKAYLPKSDMSIEDFTAAAEGSRTVFSIAHPLINYLDDGDGATIEATMPRVLSSLRERGFKGVEAYYGASSPEVRALMVKLTRDAGMIPTGGSDYHGTFKENVALGRGLTGDLRVPAEVVDELKAAR